MCTWVQTLTFVYLCQEQGSAETDVQVVSGYPWVWTGVSTYRANMRVSIGRHV